jgi:hypothetical protein
LWTADQIDTVTAAVALKQDILTPSSVVEVDSLTATGIVTAGSLEYIENANPVDVAAKFATAESARAALETRIQALEDYIASLTA